MGMRLKATTRRMSRLIDDVLDFARGRLGSGMGILLSQSDDLATALADVVAELRAANPGRTVLEQISIERRVNCDRGRIQQLLSNLLANALTHGAPDQPVLVDISTQEGVMTLRVTNAGEPIAPENLQNVFQPYWRLSASQRDGGLGLGLYICSQIAKAHGGTLEVSSSREDGTCFFARLPLTGCD
jgi:hypothetical protein